MTELTVRNIHKQLGTVQVLRGTSFQAEKGRILALLGASGSGKTTLLRCIAGLEQPETGFIDIGGTVVLDTERNVVLPPERRNIGLVFQSYALWPHRKIFDNVAYGLKLRGVGAEDARSRVARIMETLGLRGLADRYPDQLSGGQQQRVAICRALVYEPKLLLLDEPLSNLDAKLREEARFWIRKLILDLELCAIMVTHDQAEALAMADHVLLLKDGVIVQEGRPIDIYSQPKTLFAAEFLGANNLIEGRVTSVTDKEVTLEGSNWTLAGIRMGDGALAMGDAGAAVVRVEALRVSDAPGPQRLEMDVEGCLYLGDRWEYRLSRGDLKARAHGPAPLPSRTVWCEFPKESVWVFPSTRKDPA